ncbi:MAG: S1C family serine protease [Verrucomicrobia bacterium]|nr:S1C family serine protease [Verrucomicrobiota bacterium]
MRFSALLWLVLVCVSAPVVQLSAQSQGDFLVLQNRITELYREHRTAMVRVKAVHASEKEGEDVPQLVIGTGFFISREGLILTNASIVANPVRVWVEHNGIAYSCDVVGIDAPTNIALLRIHSLPRQFSFFHLADAAEPPPIGSFVMRLSMPLEFDVTPDLGLITGVEGRFGNRFFPCNFIRTNISAGPGDGGAAYVDLSGRLLGLQVGSLPELRATYMLPARAALRIRDDLLFSGEVRYGWIGFEVREESSIVSGPSLVINSIIPERLRKPWACCLEM